MGLFQMTLIIGIAALTAPAFAGTLLRFNSGTVSSQTASRQYEVAWKNPPAAADYIVQFKKSITASDREALSQQFQIFGYLPDDALVVRGTFAQLQAFEEKHPQVQAVVRYQAQYKLSTDLAPMSVFDQDNSEEILIRTFSESDTSQVAMQIRALGFAVQDASGRSILVAVARKHIPAIAAMTGVEHIQPNPVVEAFHFVMDQTLADDVGSFTPGDYSDLNGSESGTKVMNFDAAWVLGYTGRGQVTSVADTGLDSGDLNAIHRDFGGGIVSGYPFGLWSKTWDDPMGHGTHVAGSVVGRGTSSKGLLKGGAYEARLVAESMWSPMLKNLSVPNKLSDLFATAYSDGARVHSNSWGGAKSFGAYDIFAVQVDEWSSANPDMLILFAAGNSGVDANKDGRIDQNSMASPGTAKNVLTVGASENEVTSGGIQVPISRLSAAKESWSTDPINSDYISNNKNGLAMFSSRGPTTDGRIKPDLVAPGTNILSARTQAKDATTLWGAYNQEYLWAGGTSMATPLTAGAVTVLRQILIEKLGIQNPSAALMKAAMLHTAVDMYPGQFGEVGAARGQEILTRRPNSDAGYGRVDVSNIASLAAPTQLIDHRLGLSEGQEVDYSFTLAAPGRVYANLVWTDVPGSPNAAQALVNDLDLILILPTGQTVSMNDHVNNLEMVELDLPAGAYKLRVRGHKVPQAVNGAQSFALVYTAK